MVNEKQYCANKFSPSEIPQCGYQSCRLCCDYASITADSAGVCGVRGEGYGRLSNDWPEKA